MAKTNYNYEKRQRELAMKKKQDEKRLRKLSKSGTAPESTGAGGPDDAPADASSNGGSPF